MKQKNQDMGIIGNGIITTLLGTAVTTSIVGWFGGVIMFIFLFTMTFGIWVLCNYTTESSPRQFTAYMCGLGLFLITIVSVYASGYSTIPLNLKIYGLLIALMMSGGSIFAFMGFDKVKKE